MKRILIFNPILDLNDLPLRYINADMVICDRHFADIICDKLERMAVPLAKVETYLQLAELIAAQTGEPDLPIELTDEQFELVNKWIQKSGMQLIIYRWNEMVDAQNPVVPITPKN